jgi:hypothetical protein
MNGKPRHLLATCALAIIVALWTAAAVTRAYVPPQPTVVDLSQAGKPSKNLVLTLALSKSKYYAGDPIPVTLTVKNLGPEVWIQRSTYDVDYSFSFFSQTGDELQIRQLNLPSTGRASTGEQLANGSTWSDKFDLDDYYSLVKFGTYKVVASSQIYLKDQASVYTTLISNPITFRIVLR